MLDPTGVTFKKGQALSSDSLNAMNDKINQLVMIVNQLLKDRVNVNIEILGTTNQISFSRALELIPENRHVPGVTIKFNESESGWSTYIWTGRTWESKDCWTRISDTDEIDGGEI